MFRKLILAAAITLGAWGGHAVTSPAQADVRIFLGIPFQPYQMGPGWRYHPDYGWYDYDRYGAFRPHKLSCGEARRRVDRNGYNNVDARNCSGRTYSFRATTRKGKRVTVYVDAFNGDMWR
jgi:hypothetical protein